MNNQPSTGKRIVTWGGFIVVIGLIIWGLIAANNKSIDLAKPLTLAVPVTSSDWITASTTSAVTLVEYSDFQCPACASYAPYVERLVKEAGDKFRFVYRHFPLPQHGNAYAAAIAAEAAGRQGKFWEMSSMLFEGQSDWEGSDKANDLFADYAKTLKLDLKKFVADIADQTLRDKVEEQYKGGAKARIYGTPTFFLNGTSIESPRNYDELKAIIEKANQ
jgi:protein-disulfide isomerase